MIRVYLLLGENTLSTSSSRPIFDRERLYPARGWKPDYGAWPAPTFWRIFNDLGWTKTCDPGPKIHNRFSILHARVSSF